MMHPSTIPLSEGRREINASESSSHSKETALIPLSLLILLCATATVGFYLYGPSATTPVGSVGRVGTVDSLLIRQRFVSTRRSPRRIHGVPYHDATTIRHPPCCDHRGWRHMRRLIVPVQLHDISRSSHHSMPVLPSGLSLI